VQFAFFSAYFLVFHPVVQGREQDWFQRTMVVGLLTMALGAFCSFLPHRLLHIAVSHGSRRSGYGNYGPSGVGKSLRVVLANRKQHRAGSI